jgi:O-antigen/teichoic acid export membrane protein
VTAPSEVAPAVTGARIIRNTLVNGVATFSGMAVTVVLTPLMLDRLGPSSFGVWALALTLTVASGYLSLTDLGLQQASVRFLADARREADTDAVGAIFSATLVILCGAAVVAAVVVILLSSLFADLFGVRAALRHAAIVTFIVAGSQVLFDLPALAYRSVLESAQRYIAIRTVDLGRAFAFAALTATVLLLGRGVVAVAVSSLLAAAGALVGYALVVHRTDPAARLRRKGVDRTLLRRLARFGGSLFVLRILSVAYRQMDKLIIGISLTVASVASFEIANRLGAALLLAVGVMGSALLPAASISRLDPGRMRQLFLRVTAYSVAVFLPLSVAAIIFAHQLVAAWVGEDTARTATSAAQLFFAWVAVGTFDAAGTTMLVSVGRLRPIIRLSIVWVLANLALSIVFVRIWGIAGVVAATVITYIPLLVAYTTICLDQFEIPLRLWLRRVVVPNVPGPIVAVAVAFALRPYLLKLGDAPAAIIGILGTSTIALLVYAAFGIDRDERTALFGSVRSALGRTG